MGRPGSRAAAEPPGDRPPRALARAGIVLAKAMAPPVSERAALRRARQSRGSSVDEERRP